MTKKILFWLIKAKTVSCMHCCLWCKYWNQCQEEYQERCKTGKGGAKIK